MRILIIIIILLSQEFISYNNIDSLKYIVNTSKTDTLVLKSLLKLSQHYKEKDPYLSLKYSFKGLKLSNKLKDTLNIIYFKVNIGTSYYTLAKYDSSLIYWLNGYKLSEKISFTKGIAMLSGNLGLIYEINNDFDNALKYQQISLTNNKKLNNLYNVAGTLNNIGILYSYKNNYDKELEYYNEALKLRLKLGDSIEIASSYLNIGTVYYAINDYNNAFRNYILARDIYKKLKNINGLSEVCLNIGQLYVKKKNGKQAIKFLNESLEHSLKENNKLLIKEIYLNLSDAYSINGDILESYEYFKKFSNLKDSIFNQESFNQITEMQTKYETEKKESEILLLNKDKQLKNTELLKRNIEVRKQRAIIYSFIIGFIIIVLFTIIIYRLYRQKMIANIILAQQKEEISAQRDEIETQRDLVTNQKEHIEEIHKEVTDSINYAKRIQDAVLPVSENARTVLGEHFILFKPKDIVSGDFYWITKINNWLIVTVADCTGHGVPGAFMSMLGISFLNEIVRKQEINQANEVLNELRKEIINALQQKGKLGEQKDGMDISLIAINTETFECQWAGANNPLYVIGRSETSKQSVAGISSLIVRNNDVELYEIKADKMPIAIYEKMDKFTMHNIQLKKGDIIYLFGDGYQDQFGGAEGKKFMSKKFKELLLQISDKPMTEQYAILDQTITNWTTGFGKKYPQTDDITVMGIKI